MKGELPETEPEWSFIARGRPKNRDIHCKLNACISVCYGRYLKVNQEGKSRKKSEVNRNSVVLTLGPRTVFLNEATGISQPNQFPRFAVDETIEAKIA